MYLLNNKSYVIQKQAPVNRMFIPHIRSCIQYEKRETEYLIER